MQSEIKELKKATGQGANEDVEVSVKKGMVSLLLRYL